MNLTLRQADIPAHLVQFFRPRNVLKPKDLCGIPWRVAFALRADGWYLRSDIIWSKPNPMPESVTDRPTKAHEYIFLLSKSAAYFYDAEAIQEEGSGRIPGNRVAQASDVTRTDVGRLLRAQQLPQLTRNKRSVWHVATQPYPEAHFATFPEKLIEPCILAGTSEKGCCPSCLAPWVRVTRELYPEAKIQWGDNHPNKSMRWWSTRESIGWEPSCDCHAGEPIPCTVLDPFTGSGTTGAVAVRHQRNFIGCELNPSYVELARKRIGAVAPLFAEEKTA